ncbi:hypothetical protein ACFFR3_20025 [Nonomuraea salmonea]|uniref:Ldh family oxidoreductase n=1 Tax=Nonomuraea salmonea TaxID=46181 RepID=A0ABV5NNF9_9ACTN
MNASVRVLAADHLRPLARDLLTAASVPHDTASAVAEPLVEADLAGHGPHGARRVKPYLDRVETASSPRRDRAIVRGAVPEEVVPGEPEARTRAERLVTECAARREPVRADRHTAFYASRESKDIDIAAFDPLKE